MPPTTRSKHKLTSAEEKILPTEVVYEILSKLTLDYEELKNFRYVKKSWNDAACRLMSSHPQQPAVSIPSRQAFLRILSIRGNAHQPNYLTKFSLVLSKLNIATTVQFGIEFGSSIRTLTVDTRRLQSCNKRTLDKLNQLLRHTPRLESLTLIGNNDGTSFMEDLDESIELRRLKRLEFKSPFDPVLSVINHSVVTRWVARTRSLTHLTVSSTLNPTENGELDKFFGRIGPIQNLNVCLRFKADHQTIFRALVETKVKVHSLNLVVEMDEADDHNLLFLNLYTWLATQSPHLTQFIHQLHTQITDGPILDKLRLFRQPLLTTGRSVQPFRVGQSSSLYFVNILSVDENAEKMQSYQPHLASTGLFEHMEQSIISINKKTANILKYLFPNLFSVHSSHYFVA